MQYVSEQHSLFLGNNPTETRLKFNNIILVVFVRGGGGYLMLASKTKKTF